MKYFCSRCKKKLEKPRVRKRKNAICLKCQAKAKRDRYYRLKVAGSLQK